MFLFLNYQCFVCIYIISGDIVLYLTTAVLPQKGKTLLRVSVLIKSICVLTKLSLEFFIMWTKTLVGILWHLFVGCGQKK